MGIKSHLQHRLNPRTIAKEVIDHIEKKVLPHGADEVANALFTGSAYLPWPGRSGPQPISVPASAEGSSLYGPAGPEGEPGSPGDGLSLYVHDGEIMPPEQTRAADRPQLESPIIENGSYERGLEQAARRGTNRSEGLSR